LRPQIFQAGTAALFLNILMMEHASSYTKETYALALVSLCQDPVVSASWLKNEPGETSKFGRLIAGNDEELCLISLSLIALLAVCPDNALQLISARNLTAQVRISIEICPVLLFLNTSNWPMILGIGGRAFGHASPSPSRPFSS
jgi:hypothetical protein